MDLSAYRIVQEALTNSLKHAGPTARAHVDVRYGTTDIRVQVRDDGIGRTGSTAPGQGLVGIRERVAVVGGTVDASPGVGGGFVVAARLPYAFDSPSPTVAP